MILKNISNEIQKINGKLVRIYRTIEVDDDTIYNNQVFERIDLQIKKTKNKINKGDK